MTKAEQFYAWLQKTHNIYQSDNNKIVRAIERVQTTTLNKIKQ